VILTEEDDEARIVRSAETVNVVVRTGDDYDEGVSIRLACEGPPATVSNTDLIRINQGGGASSGGIEIDLSGGPLAPGATAEADGTPEIEVQADMLGQGSTVSVIGSAAADAFDFGRTTAGGFGANLNGGSEPAPDVDVLLNGVEVVAVDGEAGGDVISAAGAPGFAGPLKGTGFVAQGDAGRDRLTGGALLNVLRGGAKRDRLVGTRQAEYLAGGSGNDVILAKGGGDLVNLFEFVRSSGRDRVSCGKGNDFLAGRSHKAKGCEPHKRRARPPRKLTKKLFPLLFGYGPDRIYSAVPAPGGGS
jgi:Ca2+-binding RTX toxin-like protein